MTQYKALYRTECEYALYHFEADSPEHALQLARELYERDPDALRFDFYESPFPLEEIEISGANGYGFAVWQSDDLRLRLAARRLFDALQDATAALNAAPPFKVPGLNSDSAEIAALCEAALDKAKPRGS